MHTTEGTRKVKEHDKCLATMHQRRMAELHAYLITACTACCCLYRPPPAGRCKGRSVGARVRVPQVDHLARGSLVGACGSSSSC